MSISDLTLLDTAATGGAGGADGGGGAGLGGGLFVAGPTQGAAGGDITLEDVTFTGDSATGGDGSERLGGSFGGGGAGLGGAGGPPRRSAPPARSRFTTSTTSFARSICISPPVTPAESST